MLMCFTQITVKLLIICTNKQMYEDLRDKHIGTKNSLAKKIQCHFLFIDQ